MRCGKEGERGVKWRVSYYTPSLQSTASHTELDGGQEEQREKEGGWKEDICRMASNDLRYAEMLF